MLVLSRRINEKLLLPDINVVVQVVGMRPGQVRLGIEAPANVQVLRAEIANQYVPAKKPESNDPGATRHALANRMNAASASVALMRRQLQAGLIEEAQTTLERLAREVNGLQEHVEAIWTPAPPSPVADKPRQPLGNEESQNECEMLAALLRSRGLDVPAIPTAELTKP